MQVREVVAGVVTDGERICLVHRSTSVTSDPGLWHCVTGYRQPGVSPRQQLLTELNEELKLRPDDIVAVKSGAPLRLADAGALWIVHCFTVVVGSGDFRLNWENDRFAWVALDSPFAASYPAVTWLPDVLRSLGYGNGV